MSLLGSRMLFGLALAFVLLSASVNAHGWMSSPTPRGQFLTPPKPAYMEIASASIDAMDPMIQCRNDPVAPKDKWITLTAGTQQSISLEFTAKHVGDCFVYLSYDGDKSPAEMKWFKIWQQHSCSNSSMYNIDIPSYLPAGDHVVFRWEWYALHKYPTVEYYAQCADAIMKAAPGASSARVGLPQPQVNIPGNLPVLAGEFISSTPELSTNNYWWPFDKQAMFFTGPPVATLGGATTTTKPTTQPTAAPTSKPVTPAPTAAPTSKPVTPAPTTAPVTPAPTSAPSSPAYSVKLNVLPGSGSWWFVVTLSGHRASEIASVQLMDSGVVGSFSPMAKSWVDATLGQVWVFDPSPRGGALTLPITVKASLASGSSITFTSNKFSNNVIDSGTVFP